MLAPGVGLGAPHFFMLQVVLKEKLILSHLGQVQSPSESPSGPPRRFREAMLSLFSTNAPPDHGLETGIGDPLNP